MAPSRRTAVVRGTKQNEFAPSSFIRPNDLGPTTFFGKIRHEDGLLRLPDQSGGTLFDRPLMAAHEIGRHVRLNGVQPHRVSDRIV